VAAPLLQAQIDIKAPAAKVAVNALFGGVEDFERDLVDNMNASLANIKAAAEQA
jgi:hypothetical protein